MKWLKLSNRTSLDPKLRMISRSLGIPFGNVYATWVALLERAAQHNYMGRFCEYCNLEFKEELSFQLEYSLDDIEKILSKFDGRITEGNTIKNWTKYQIDPTNKERQLKYRRKTTQHNDTNSESQLCNEVTTEESRIDKKEKVTKVTKKKKLSLSKKSDLETWEKNFGELSVDHLGKWVEENSLCREKLSQQITAFRTKCEAKGYQYVNFPSAFKDWGVDKKAATVSAPKSDKEKWRC